MIIRNIILSGILGFCLIGNATADLNNGLVAYYPFDGTPDEMTGNGVNGIEYGGVQYIDGVVGKALKLDGHDDYIRIPQSNSLRELNQFTIAYWVKYYKPTSGSNNVSTTVCNGPDTNHNGIGDGFFTYAGSDGIGHYLGKWKDAVKTIIPLNAREALSQQEYVFAVFSADADKIRSYKNGSLIEEVNRQNKSASGRPEIDWYVGQSGNKSYFLNGHIDELRIFNRTLSESEIQELFKKDSNACTEYDTPNVTPNLDIHLPSLNYRSLTETLNFWVDLEFYGRNGNDLIWKLERHGENLGSAVGCNSDESAIVSPNLDIQILSIDYQLLSGTLNLWANFEYYGESTQGELLWKLIGYGETE